MDLLIRNEIESDLRDVEELTREAFWNLYVKGCDEHYLVHILRDHPDFIRELNYVAEYKGKIIGNIMYAKSYVYNDLDNRIDTISFGPVSVLPEYQRKGVGTALIQHTMKLAIEKGHKAIIIEGYPHNYCKHGFKSSMDFGISDSDGKFPYGLLALELEKNVFKGQNWKVKFSDVYDLDKKEVHAFDKQFDFKEKEYKYSQEVFKIAIRSRLS